jgi:hypothetical protein
MPKLLVLFHSCSSAVTDLAEAVVEGARTVRFAEVDLRRLAAAEATTATGARDPVDAPRHRTLGEHEQLASYDGIVYVTAGDDTAALVTHFGGRDRPLTDKVGSAITPATGRERSRALWATLAPMADRGMILVPAPFTDSTESAAESARQLGKRMADVIGWVTHARSHHHHH